MFKGRVSGLTFIYGLILIAIILPLGTPCQQQFVARGVTEPMRQAIISADFAASIQSIIKDEGSHVNKGDTILALDFEAARLDAERNRLIAENRAELEAVRLKMKTAKIDLDATKLLFDSTRAVSEEELWKKELDYNLAKTEFDRLSMTKEKEVIEHEIALDHLRHFFVIAPFTGIVAQRFLNESEICKAQEQLIKIVDIHKCRFITYVPSVHSQELKKGRSVTLTLDGVKSPRTRTGVVEFVSPVVDASSGLRTVKILFDNTDESIQPGVGGTMLIEE